MLFLASVGFWNFLGAGVFGFLIPTGPGAGEPAGTLDSSGHFTLGGLGPYQWPLFFVAQGQPDQWSGGVGNRNKATNLVTVVADSTVTVNQSLSAGSTVTGVVRTSAGALVTAGRISAVNAATGDEIGGVELAADGSYRLQLIGNETVKFWVEDYRRLAPGYWFGGTDLGSATGVSVPGRKPLTQNITIE